MLTWGGGQNKRASALPMPSETKSADRSPRKTPGGASQWSSSAIKLDERGNSELFVLVAGLAAGFGCAALVPTVIYEEGGGGARGERTKGGRGRGEIT